MYQCVRDRVNRMDCQSLLPAHVLITALVSGLAKSLWLSPSNVLQILTYRLHLRTLSETKMCLDFWEGKKTTKKQWAKHIVVWIFVLIRSLSRLLILH